MRPVEWEIQQLRIGPRADGRSWTIETTSVECGLAEASRLIAAY